MINNEYILFFIVLDIKVPSRDSDSWHLFIRCDSCHRHYSFLDDCQQGWYLKIGYLLYGWWGDTSLLSWEKSIIIDVGLRTVYVIEIFKFRRLWWRIDFYSRAFRWVETSTFNQKCTHTLASLMSRCEALWYLHSAIELSDFIPVNSQVMVFIDFNQGFTWTIGHDRAVTLAKTWSTAE